MNVFVLEAHVAYEGGSVVGVYSTHEAAMVAARAFEAANRAQRYPTDFGYCIHEVGVDAVGHDRRFDGDLLEVE